MQKHIEVPEQFTKAILKIALNDDNIGYVESYDFSRANMSQESRIAAITSVASVCYANPKALGSINLYNRLATENKGLPSSSYEFVPVLLDTDEQIKIEEFQFDKFTSELHCHRYGEFVEDGGYLLTNLRALIADVGDIADQFFNTEEECTVIAKHFKVYKSKIDLSTTRQFMRHRCSWQELSRRYVSGKRAEFEFYISPKMADLESRCDSDGYEDVGILATEDLHHLLVTHYDQAILDGVKPEEARRILPQAMYTTIWSAWQPKQLEVLYKLRCDKHAQQEIQDLAYAMKDLTK